MDFTRAKLTCLFWLTKWSYIVLRAMRLTYTRGLIRFSNCAGLSRIMLTPVKKASHEFHLTMMQKPGFLCYLCLASRSIRLRDVLDDFQENKGLQKLSHGCSFRVSSHVFYSVLPRLVREIMILLHVDNRGAGQPVLSHSVGCAFSFTFQII